MKSIYKRITHWLLIAALVITMQPIAPATSDAAPGDPVYFQFNDFSTVETAPSEVNTNLIDIAGTFSLVTSISYRIEKLVLEKGQYVVKESSNSSTQPIISGSSFRFSAVTIYEGLNRIKLLGVNSVGNVVSGEAYVNFSNVPIISDVKLSDGRVLDPETPLITNRINEAISVKATNATRVSINGVEMFGGSGSTYLLNNLGLFPGYNKLVIVASNATKTYEVTRELVYFNDKMVVYGTKWDTKGTGNPVIPDDTPLDGNPLYIKAISSTISANVVLKADTSATPIAPDFVVEIVDSNGSPLTTVQRSTADYDPTKVKTVSGYTIYPIKTDNNLSTAGLSNGKYFVQFSNTAVVGSPVFRVPFSIRDKDSPVINSIKQAYDVTEGASNVATYVSTSSFIDKSTIYSSPLWVVLDIGYAAGDIDDLTPSVTASTYGNASLPASEFHYDVYTVSGSANTNQIAIKIDKLPSATVKLTFEVKETSGSLFDSVERTITFTPAPSIQVKSIYNGQPFETKSLPTIVGKLVNFDLANANELATFNIILNGKSVNVKATETASASAGAKIYTNSLNTDGLGYKAGEFRLDPNYTLAPATSPLFELLPGANTLIFEGVAGGVPVTTKFTVYYFSADNPTITGIRPVPFVIDPQLDSDISDIKRRFDDKDVQFAITGDNQYSTSERSLDLLFDVQDLTDLEVQVNGTKIATANVDTGTTNAGQITSSSVPADVTKLFIEEPSASGGRALFQYIDGSYTYKIRLSEIKLPQSGNTNVTIIARKGTVSVSETITIVRDLSPYLILSPRFPNQSVINSNFLKVSIKAEGATSVLLGKTPMVKGSGDIFRYEMKNLKVGKNTVKFTVQQGTQKINGSFDVNYAGDNSISAEYKAPIPTSGKVSMFKGELSLAFPKNTFLRQANVSPGQDVKTVNLFDKQELYFGIADRADGRTVKVYNAVGETDLSGNPQDGKLVNIAPLITATERLLPKQNFTYASNLYWIDSGYFKGTGLVNDYELVPPMHPYVTTNNGDDVFYLRALDPNKWLEPSQRSTISIKYDSNIVDTLARNLSIWRYTGQSWENVGGVVDTKKKTVTAPFDGFGYYSVMSLRYSYSDINGHDYARLALETMFARGIMTNKDNNSFGVYDNISRGEFSQMLVKMLDIPLEYDPEHMTFDDVLPIDYPDALWNYRYVETAVKKGFVRGRSPRLFWPYDSLTREEAAVMIARALNLVKNNADMEKDKAALQKSFTDANLIELYSASSVLAIQKAGYISGIPNNIPGAKNSFRFEPDSNLSRADAAVIVERIMKKLKKL